MEAIKKKVQAMKVEKDNLCDRCDEVEQVGANNQECRLRYQHLSSAENEGGHDPQGQGRGGVHRAEFEGQDPGDRPGQVRREAGEAGDGPGVQGGAGVGC